MSSSTPKRIDIVVYKGFKALEAIGSISVFEYANLHLIQQGRVPGYAIDIASEIPGPIQSDTHMLLDATRVLNASDLPDTAILIGARQIETALEENPGIAIWAAAVAPHIGRMVALCSGSFFLASAGLLDGIPATTHWNHANLLREKYPNVLVQEDAIYLRSGRIWTSAGVTAGIDLALALVEDDFGKGLALKVARDLVVYLKRPGGQSQFSAHLHSQHTSHKGIRDLQNWALCNLTQPLNILALASRAAMSERNFRRVFTLEVGMSPAAFVESARLESARRLLEEGDLPLKAIAFQIGYTSESALRKLFIKHLAVTPQDYRNRFG